MKDSAPAASLVLASAGMGKSSGPSGGGASPVSDAVVRLVDGRVSLACSGAVHAVNAQHVRRLSNSARLWTRITPTRPQLATCRTRRPRKGRTRSPTFPPERWWSGLRASVGPLLRAERRLLG